jgi:hypothetical protein
VLCAVVRSCVNSPRAACSHHIVCALAACSLCRLDLYAASFATVTGSSAARGVTIVDVTLELPGVPEKQPELWRGDILRIRSVGGGSSSPWLAAVELQLEVISVVRTTVTLRVGRRLVSDRCMACNDAGATNVVTPCHHQVVCAACAKRLRTSANHLRAMAPCPLCRVPVESGRCPPATVLHVDENLSRLLQTERWHSEFGCRASLLAMYRTIACPYPRCAAPVTLADVPPQCGSRRTTAPSS